jgi:hypothetical protein
VLYLSQQDTLSKEDRRKVVVGLYLAIMSGVFAGAEARMGGFARNRVAGVRGMPLKELAALVKREYGIKSMDNLFRHHLDLVLNIAHGGITLDKNPEELQRDHIFPRSKMEAAGFPYDKVNHYANFHFLRASDNLNKTDKDPEDWFKNPGKNASAYSDQDLAERLLSWDDLKSGGFEDMLERRGKRIRQKAEQVFGMIETEFDALFEES